MKKSNDLLNLEIIYNQMYELTIQIGQLIDRKLYNDIVGYMNKKDQLLKDSNSIIERIKATNEDVSCLEPICQKIHDQELANISALTIVKDQLKKEINKTSKTTKMVNAYSSKESVQGSILDFRE